MSSTKEQLFNEALKAQKNAYAPYSQFYVGAAIKLKDVDTIYSGCNIENMSYGGTICAERVALTKALSENPENRTLSELALVTKSDHFDTPCGICRQFMGEFSDKDTLIHLCNENGIQKTVSFSELFPYQFESPLVKKS